MKIKFSFNPDFLVYAGIETMIGTMTGTTIENVDGGVREIGIENGTGTGTGTEKERGIGIGIGIAIV